MRQTSIDAYHKIQEDGLLSKRRWEVYDIVFRHGPCTANEAFSILKSEKYKNLRFDSNTHARFTELNEMDAIYVFKWLLTKNKKLDGRGDGVSPLLLINRGKAQKVLDLLNSTDCEATSEDIS